ncbi:hypothetical protein EMCRGX_G007035 [Ephydatia muelleri]
MEGSQLYKRNNRCKDPSCPWKGVWLGGDLCFSTAEALKDLSLEYNATTRQYQDQPGISIKALGFGETCKVEYLMTSPIETGCPIQLPLMSYFHNFVKYFVAQGYERNKTIRGAPYDWRFAPDQLQERGYYGSVKALIEQMYKDGGNKKVTLVAHSMGGPVTLYFLNNVVTQAWKDTYVNAFVPLSGAWSGSSKIVMWQISGERFMEISLLQGLCHFPPNTVLLFRNASRTLPSLLFLLPEPSVRGNAVLVSTRLRNYTAGDYTDLFNDIGHSRAGLVYNSVRGINAGFPPPRVPVYCFYGVGVSTPESFVYDDGFPDSAPREVNGNGDGTVNVWSSEVCLKWRGQQAQPFVSRTFRGVSHNAMTENRDVLDAVGNIVLSV